MVRARSLCHPAPRMVQYLCVCIYIVWLDFNIDKTSCARDLMVGNESHNPVIPCCVKLITSFRCLFLGAAGILHWLVSFD